MGKQARINRKAEQLKEEEKNLHILIMNTALHTFYGNADKQSPSWLRLLLPCIIF